MIKLNLTKEQIESDVDNNSVPYEGIKQDWLTMYAELERMNKALREAVKEINDFWFAGHSQGTTVSIGILRKHFPELKEDEK